MSDLLEYLTPVERAELAALQAPDLASSPWLPLEGPQLMAYDSDADIVGYGGAAGGGKTDLIAGLVLTKHKRALIARREKAQTEGIVQRLTEIVGATGGYSSQRGAWQLPGDRLVEFAGLSDPGDERRWQGRPHDLKAFDEATEMREHQVRFVMGWNRTSDPTVKCKTLLTFNPPTTAEGRWVVAFFGPWLDTKHPMYPTPPGALRYCTTLPAPDGTSKDRWVDRPDPFVLVDDEPCYEFDPAAYKPEDIITPKSRTFIPARLTDNRYYMATGYMQQLQALPEPLRSQMLNGDFMAGVEDHEFQLIPTAWVEAAQARWKPLDKRGEMLALGIDVARGGKDNTVLFPRHAHPVTGNPYWFDKPKRVPGKDTPTGFEVAGLAVGMLRDSAPVLVDVIGVGAAAVDALRAATSRLQVIGVNVSEAPTRADRTGQLRFRNQRDQYLWALRELLDPTYETGAALPPDPQLLRELTAFRWKPVGRTIHVSSRDEVIAAIGSSPDLVSALMLAAIDVPKVAALEAANARREVLAYNPASVLDYTPGGDL